MAKQPYQQVHEAVQKHLDISRRGVNLRREKLQRRVSMPDDIALYIEAQRAGVPIHRWVKDADVLAQVATFEARLAAKEAPSPEPTPTATRRRTSASANGKSQRSPGFALNKISVPAGVLSDRHRRDAVEMAVKVYPLLYAFENSVREFIDGHLTGAYSKDWWDDPKLVKRDVRETVERKRKADSVNRTHSARNARPIYYTTFGELVSIVQSEKGAKVFKRPLFPRSTWFPELVKASEHTRNIVAHMNPLKQRDIRRLEVAFEDWLSQIKDNLPPTIP